MRLNAGDGPMGGTSGPSSFVTLGPGANAGAFSLPTQHAHNRPEAGLSHTFGEFRSTALRPAERYGRRVIAEIYRIPHNVVDAARRAVSFGNRREGR